MPDLLNLLHDIVGDLGLLTGAEAQERPADWLGQTRCKAAAIVRPKSTEELSAVMKACHDARQPVVAAGGLTGLVHGADASANELIVSFERMNQIEQIDPVERTITVQAGVRTEAAQVAARDQGVLFAVDLGARGSSTIGGNISTNAGGNQVLRYGMMREQVLGLEAVLADGTILSAMSPLMKNNTGYDLKQLFVGSEGTLGLVTRAVLRLHPLPTSEATALAAVKDLTSVAELLRLMDAKLCGTLTAFEVMWNSFYRTIVVEGGRHTAPLSPGSPYYVLMEANGGDPDIDSDRFNRALEAAIAAGLVEDAVIASSSPQRDGLWAIREDVGGLVQALSPFCTFDVSLPIRAMENYVQAVEVAIFERFERDSNMVVFGHLGDGNLHLLIAPRPWSDEARQHTERIVYETLAKVGGSVSAEHGIGLEKKDWLSLTRSREEIALMRRLKAALDPQGVLNPGKIFDMTSDAM